MLAAPAATAPATAPDTNNTAAVATPVAATPEPAVVAHQPATVTAPAAVVSTPANTATPYTAPSTQPNNSTFYPPLKPTKLLSLPSLFSCSPHSTFIPFGLPQLEQVSRDTRLAF